MLFIAVTNKQHIKTNFSHILKTTSLHKNKHFHKKAKVFHNGSLREKPYCSTLKNTLYEETVVRDNPNIHF